MSREKCQIAGAYPANNAEAKLYVRKGVNALPMEQRLMEMEFN
jgi:hypothetical protein